MDSDINMQVYENAVATLRKSRMSFTANEDLRFRVLKKLIETGEFEMPRLGEMDREERLLWEKLSEYTNLDRNAQIQVFVNLVRQKVPQRYWINLV